MHVLLLVIALVNSHLSGPPPPGDGTRWSWPLAPRPTVTARFTPGAHNWDPGHRGADLAGREGGAVTAVASGRVVFAGTLAGRGVVSVQHPDGRRSTYEPLRPEVHRGDQVVRGQRLGALLPGHPGCPVPACLHLGLLVGRDRYGDPLPLMARKAVLLPPRRGEQH